jgi:hypothetical protein
MNYFFVLIYVLRARGLQQLTPKGDGRRSEYQNDTWTTHCQTLVEADDQADECPATGTRIACVRWQPDTPQLVGGQRNGIPK